MSFSFIGRSSSKNTGNKINDSANSNGRLATSANCATNLGHEPSRPTQNGHTRNSSRIRILPFLGKRRKSFATLRTNVKELSDEPSITRERGHHKSVSQLANETAARLARSSLGAAGSLSTGNLELSAHDMVHIKSRKDPEHGTPFKTQPTNTRYSIFSPGNAQNSAPDRLSVQPKSKGSFLSRITSRPSLSARYSSADLKTAKSRSLFRTPEKYHDSNVPQRPEIVYSATTATKCNTLSEDRDFFTSPRIAPTPPNLTFTSPGSSLMDSPVQSQSSLNLSGLKGNTSLSAIDTAQSPTARRTRSPNVSPLSNKPRSTVSVASPQSLSPEAAYTTPRRNSVSQIESPVLTLSAKSKHSSTLGTATASPVRPRTGMVRIGKENVTVSVANVLESELGIEVGDSEDSSFSYYEDSFEDKRRPFSQNVVHNQKKLSKKERESPRFSNDPSSVYSKNTQAYKFPEIVDDARSILTLEARSPLMTPELDAGTDKRPEEERDHTPENFIHKAPENRDTRHLTSVSSKQISHSKSLYLPLGNSIHVREVDRMDRISERSVRTNHETPNRRYERKGEPECSPQVTAKLQQSLDIQCARFDKLAGHLLQIIQRHQNEKVQLESRILTLEKENRKNEREVKALKRLLSLSSQEKRKGGGRLVRVASMQSFLSNTSFQDNNEEVDIDVAAEMLSRASRKDGDILSPEDTRASIDLSPNCTPNKTKIRTTEQLRRSKTMPDLHKTSASPASRGHTNFPGSTLIPTIPSSESPLIPGTSSDVSGHGLGLDFPLPAPIKLPSISSTIISSAAASDLSIPALTTAPTAISGLSAISIPSLELKKSVDSFAALAATVPQIDDGLDDTRKTLIPAPTGPDDEAKVRAPLRGGTTGTMSPAKSSREKRRAGEWRNVDSSSIMVLGGKLNDKRGYRSVESLAAAAAAPGAPPNCQIPDLPSASVLYAGNLNKGLISGIDQIVVDRAAARKVQSPNLKIGGGYQSFATKSSDMF